MFVSAKEREEKETRIRRKSAIVDYCKSHGLAAQPFMRPGPLIRRCFGPYELAVSEAYRRIFVDLDELAGIMSRWVPRARKILEVGCGEGLMTERIVRTYPAASVMAIDISPNTGRLFRGDTSSVTFRTEPVESVASREPASFDLVILADVLHHVPPDARPVLLSAVIKSMAPNGSFIFKDWVISASPIHWLSYAFDRYLTGDHVAYLTTAGIDALMTGAFGSGAIRHKATVRPWRNNLALLIRQ
jgi:2-polyprenyl-3-methyl-5-hydroxy-6-metoxy-1,4-benzoquinol methylase